MPNHYVHQPSRQVGKQADRHLFRESRKGDYSYRHRLTRRVFSHVFSRNAFALHNLRMPKVLTKSHVHLSEHAGAHEMLRKVKDIRWHNNTCTIVLYKVLKNISRLFPRTHVTSSFRNINMYEKTFTVFSDTRKEFCWNIQKFR